MIRGRTKSLKAKIHQKQEKEKRYHRGESDPKDEEVEFAGDTEESGPQGGQEWRDHSKEPRKNIYLMDSSDSEIELPKRTAFQTQDLGDNVFLSLYRQQCDIHCIDREKARNLIHNLKMPKKGWIRKQSISQQKQDEGRCI